MSGPRATLWLLWALFLGALALELVIAAQLPARAVPWHTGQVAVIGFVLALMSMALGVWTFALRESLALRDLRAGRFAADTAEGHARLRGMWLSLWALCLLIGLLGCLLAWGSASLRTALPYAAGAAVLLLVHAPRAHFFGLGAPSPQQG